MVAANSTTEEGVNVDLMFTLSDCPLDAVPDLTASPPGPLCAVCN